MKMIKELNPRNFKFFAAKYYNNPECSDVDEFNDDVSRFKYIKRLFKRYELDDDLQERLILNHIIILYNIFGIEAANKMMWFKVDKEHYPMLKTFLVFLNYLKEDEYVHIPLDPYIVERLRKL